MQQNKPLKYVGYSVVCQEVPDEISLSFNISGCTHKCKDCHSKYLWEYFGQNLRQDLIKILPKNKDLITCILFLGGDQNIEELTELCEIVKTYGLKTCIYSGVDEITLFNKMIDKNLLDYLKIGRYISERGPLNNPNTNQIMYKIEKGILTDITYTFQKKKI